MIHFGTGGWRAIIGDGFTKANIRLLAAALAEKMKEEGVATRGIVIGYDRRFLSKEAMQWAGEVFAAEGIKALLINKSCPTPVVMYYVKENGLPYGMMITASHNPALYNGIKVFTEGGRDADLNVTSDIERYAAKLESGLPEAPEIRSMYYQDAKDMGLIKEICPLNEYLDSILEMVDVRKIRDASLHIALDPMYGVSETSIKTIFLTCRSEVESIHSRHDTLFGGKLPAPNREAMGELSRVVLDKKCDIGIATDGDADRIGVVDDTGRYLTPNDIMAVLYYYLRKYKGMRGGVVRNLCTTHLLDRIAESFHETCYEVPVGFKYISAKMEETDAVLGGESSGGLTVRGHIKGKDGVYAAALLAEMLAVTGIKLSDLYDGIRREYGAYYMSENNFSFRPERKEELFTRIIGDRGIPELPYAIDHVSYMDGCKIFFKNGGWVSCRFSGTEPLLRLFAEMPEKEDAETICRIYRDYLGI